MSIKVAFKAWLQETKPVATSKEGRKYQQLIFKVPGRVDQFGDKVSDDLIYEGIVYGDDKIIKLWEKFGNHPLPAKCEVTAYLNSRTREQDGQTYYNLSLTVQELKAAQ